MEFPSVALILAAGKGTRMNNLCDSLPKPLLVAEEKTLLEWQIINLIDAGFRKIGINLHHMADKIEKEIVKMKLSYPQIQFECSFEKNEILGQAGGINNLVHLFPKDSFFLSTNCDAFIKLHRIPLNPKFINLWVVRPNPSLKDFNKIFFKNNSYEISKSDELKDGFNYTGYMSFSRQHLRGLELNHIYHVNESLWKPNAHLLRPTIIEEEWLDLGEEKIFLNNKTRIKALLGK